MNQQVTITLEDVNQIIKHFAYHIQQRIEDLDKKRGLFSSFSQTTLNLQQHQAVSNIVSKYERHEAKTQLEGKIIRKFAERVTQIFGFFKEKGNRGRSENILGVLQARIKAKLDGFFEGQRVNVGEVLGFAVGLTRKGALAELFKGHSFKRQKPKPKRSFLKQCMTSIKISAYGQESHQGIEEENNQHEGQVQNRRRNKTMLQRTRCVKSSIKFQGIQHALQKPLPQSTTTPAHPTRPLSSLNPRLKLSSSIQSIPNAKKSLPLHNAKQSYLKVVFGTKNQPNIDQGRQQRNQKENVKERNPVGKVIDKMYVGMDVDRRWVEKMLGRREFMVREAIRRNQRIIAKMKKEEGKRKDKDSLVKDISNCTITIQTGTICPIKDEPIDITNQSQTSKPNPFPYPLSSNSLQPVSSKALQQKHPNLPSHINKKQSLRTMAYQNYMQRKRKASQNYTNPIAKYRKSISHKALIDDKENVVP